MKKREDTLWDQCPPNADVRAEASESCPLRRDRILARVTELHPDIRVIFMSGYSEDALLENRLLSQQNITLVQKPFDPEDLAHKIRESLNDKSKAWLGVRPLG